MITSAFYFYILFQLIYWQLNIVSNFPATSSVGVKVNIVKPILSGSLFLIYCSVCKLKLKFCSKSNHSWKTEVDKWNSLPFLPVFIIFSTVVYQSLPESVQKRWNQMMGVGVKICLLFNTRLIFHTETWVLSRPWYLVFQVRNITIVIFRNFYYLSVHHF